MDAIVNATRQTLVSEEYDDEQYIRDLDLDALSEVRSLEIVENIALPEPGAPLRIPNDVPVPLLLAFIYTSLRLHHPLQDEHDVTPAITRAISRHRSRQQTASTTAFRRFLFSRPTNAFVAASFWFVVIYYFKRHQPGLFTSTEHLKVSLMPALQQLAFAHSQLVGFGCTDTSMAGGRDAFLRMLPDIAAQCAFAALFLLAPFSRSRFVTHPRLKVAIVVDLKFLVDGAIAHSADVSHWPPSLAAAAAALDLDLELSTLSPRGATGPPPLKPGSAAAQAAARAESRALPRGAKAQQLQAKALVGGGDVVHGDEQARSPARHRRLHALRGAGAAAHYAEEMQRVEQSQKAQMAAMERGLFFVSSGCALPSMPKIARRHAPAVGSAAALSALHTAVVAGGGAAGLEAVKCAVEAQPQDTERSEVGEENGAKGSVDSSEHRRALLRDVGLHLGRKATAAARLAVEVYEAAAASRPPLLLYVRSEGEALAAASKGGGRGVVDGAGATGAAHAPADGTREPRGADAIRGALQKVVQMQRQSRGIERRRSTPSTLGDEQRVSGSADSFVPLSRHFDGVEWLPQVLGVTLSQGREGGGVAVESSTESLPPLAYLHLAAVGKDVKVLVAANRSDERGTAIAVRNAVDVVGTPKVPARIVSHSRARVLSSEVEPPPELVQWTAAAGPAGRIGVETRGGGGALSRYQSMSPRLRRIAVSHVAERRAALHNIRAVAADVVRGAGGMEDSIVTTDRGVLADKNVTEGTGGEPGTRGGGRMLTMPPQEGGFNRLGTHDCGELRSPEARAIDSHVRGVLCDKEETDETLKRILDTTEPWQMQLSAADARFAGAALKVLSPTPSHALPGDDDAAANSLLVSRAIVAAHKRKLAAGVAAGRSIQSDEVTVHTAGRSTSAPLAHTLRTFLSTTHPTLTGMVDACAEGSVRSPSRTRLDAQPPASEGPTSALACSALAKRAFARGGPLPSVPPRSAPVRSPKARGLLCTTAAAEPYSQLEKAIELATPSRTYRSLTARVFSKSQPMPAATGSSDDAKGPHVEIADTLLSAAHSVAAADQKAIKALDAMRRKALSQMRRQELVLLGGQVRELHEQETVRQKATEQTLLQIIGAIEDVAHVGRDDGLIRSVTVTRSAIALIDAHLADVPPEFRNVLVEWSLRRKSHLDALIAEARATDPQFSLALASGAYGLEVSSAPRAVASAVPAGGAFSQLVSMGHLHDIVRADTAAASGGRPQTPTRAARKPPVPVLYRGKALKSPTGEACDQDDLTNVVRDGDFDETEVTRDVRRHEAQAKRFLADPRSAMLSRQTDATQLEMTHTLTPEERQTFTMNVPSHLGGADHDARTAHEGSDDPFGTTSAAALSALRALDDVALSKFVPTSPPASSSPTRFQVEASAGPGSGPRLPPAPAGRRAGAFATTPPASNTDRVVAHSVGAHPTATSTGLASTGS